MSFFDVFVLLFLYVDIVGTVNVNTVRLIFHFQNSTIHWNTGTDTGHCHSWTGLPSDWQPASESSQGNMGLCAFVIEAGARGRGRGYIKGTASAGACVGSRSSSAPPTRRGLAGSAFGIDRLSSRIAPAFTQLSTTEFHCGKFTQRSRTLVR